MELRSDALHPGYLLSDDGRVFGPSGQELTLHERGKYLAFFQWRPEKKRMHPRNVHAAVCEAFHGPRPPGLVVRHLNGDCRDNRACNLEWGTRRENELDKFRHGTGRAGDRNGNSKLTDQQVAEIRRLKQAGMTGTQIASEFGVHSSTVYSICSGQHRVPPGMRPTKDR